MADDLNSLLQSQHNSTFLSGVMNPASFNPLAAQNSAVAAASNMYTLKGQQAEEAWGDALQQATDPKTGTVDYANAARIAAAKGDVTRMRMMTNLGNASNLSTQQIDQSNARRLAHGRNAAAILFDASDNNVNAEADARIREGWPADQVNANRQALLAIPYGTDGLERRRRAYTTVLGSMEPATGTAAAQGGTVVHDFGGDLGALTMVPNAPGRPASIWRSDQGVGTTLAPADYSKTAITVEATQAMVDAAVKQGRSDVVLGQPTAIPFADMLAGQNLAAVLPPHIRQGYLQQLQQPGVRNPDRSRVGPGNPAVTTPPPVQKPAPKQINVTPAPSLTNQPPLTLPAGIPTFAPGGGPAPAPVARPAAPAPPVVRVPLSAAPDGSVRTASANALEAPQTGPAAEPSPLVPSDVQAIQAGMQAARDNPRIPGTQTAGAGYSYGPGLEERSTTKLSGDSYLADKQSSLDHARNVLPLAQALSIYSRGGVTTAPGAADWNNIRGWANGALRSAGLPELLSTTRDWDELNKSLSQIATNVPSSGKSDAQLAAVIAGNASTHIHELVGANKVQATVALLRMQHVMPRVWDNMSQEDKAQYKYQYANFKQDFNNSFDLRAGASDAYSRDQKRTLLEELKKGTPEDRLKYFNSVKMLQDNGFLGEARIIP